MQLKNLLKKINIFLEDNSNIFYLLFATLQVIGLFWIAYELMLTNQFYFD